MSAVAPPVATTVDTSFVGLDTVVALAATDDFDSVRLASSDVPVDIIFVADVTVAANVAGASQ